jgi:ferredoxin-NADP reductase
MTFLIKRVENGEVSPLICDKYFVNQTVFVKGPFGMKYYDPTPDVRSFICDTVKINAKHILMCSCGSGITPFYSMGVAWYNDIIADIPDTHTHIQQHGQAQSQRHELHYLSSYKTREDAVLRHPACFTSTKASVEERLFISDENTKLTPVNLIEYIINLIENPDDKNTPEDIVVFICGTPMYSQMVKDACAIIDSKLKWYEW